jgi:hypothetical protein
MKRASCLALAALAWFCSGCGDRAPARPVAAKSQTPKPAPRFTQLYATEPRVVPGGQSRICYGVENANTVWMAPPRRELSASIARCVDVTPATTTTYVLTAEAGDGRVAKAQTTVEVGPPAPPSPKIVTVTVSSLSVHPGQPVSICYEVKNAVAVTVDPIHYRVGAVEKNCALDQPARTTTYVVTAIGNGKPDSERVTISVN